MSEITCQDGWEIVKRRLLIASAIESKVKKYERDLQIEVGEALRTLLDKWLDVNSFAIDQVNIYTYRKLSFLTQNQREWLYVYSNMAHILDPTACYGVVCECFDEQMPRFLTKQGGVK